MKELKVHNRLRAKRLFIDPPAGRKRTDRQKLDKADGR